MSRIGGLAVQYDFYCVYVGTYHLLHRSLHIQTPTNMMRISWEQNILEIITEVIFSIFDCKKLWNHIIKPLGLKPEAQYKSHTPLKAPGVHMDVNQPSPISSSPVRHRDGSKTTQVICPCQKLCCVILFNTIEPLTPQHIWEYGINEWTYFRLFLLGAIGDWSNWQLI